MRQRQFFCWVLIFAMLSGCLGGNESSPQQDLSFLFNSLFYFASRRSEPLNPERDGDIFYTSAAGPAGANPLFNLTDNGSAAGDADDHLCLLDLPRFRAFFMSKRTDIGNSEGDLDIFAVPSLGGVITNLTDLRSGSSSTGDQGDDYCNALQPSTGNLVFTSNRLFNGQRDPDIYYMAIGQVQNQVIGGETVNLTTATADSDNFRFSDDRFEILVGSTLLFTGARTQGDSRSRTNDRGNVHIFSLTLPTLTQPTQTGQGAYSQIAAPSFINVSQGAVDVLGSTAVAKIDKFCGIIPVDAVEPYGVPEGIAQVVFTSDQDVGFAVNSKQFGVPENDVFVAQMPTGNTNNVHNLTDTGSGDNADRCLAVVPTRNFVAGGGPLDATEYVAVFESQRQSKGRRSGTLGNVTFDASGNATGDFDLFVTTLPQTALANRIENLTDDQAALPRLGAGADANDKYFGTCGTSIIFGSQRSDLEANPGGDLDLFLTDVAAGQVSRILPLTNNATSSNDTADCFLLCDLTLGSMYFSSLRADQQQYGPSPDADIFRVRFRDSGFGLKARGAVTIENLTDAVSGDDLDFALPAYYNPASPCSNTSSGQVNILESLVDAFTAGSPSYFKETNHRGLNEDDFAFGVDGSNQIIFTSRRPNVGNDVDIFSQSMPVDLDAAFFQNIINRTDATSAGTTADAEDGLEGLTTAF